MKYGVSKVAPLSIAVIVTSMISLAMMLLLLTAPTEPVVPAPAVNVTVAIVTVDPDRVRRMFMVTLEVVAPAKLRNLWSDAVAEIVIDRTAI